MDPTLLGALKTVSKTLGMRPTITFVDDSETSPVMQTYLQRGFGVIGIGESMLNRIYNNTRYRDEILVGLLAHESAHVLQIQRNCQLAWNGGGLHRGSCFKNLRPENGSTIGIELMADFMAGWTMARAGILTTGEFEGFGKDLFERGDFYKNSRGHHGTPRNRLNFMASGYNFGKDGGELGYYEGEFIRDAGGDDLDFKSLETAYLASQAVVVARRNRL
ncbi:hypothetical protein [Pseudorhodoplanes sp.]|uniref:hypothetical protein n=1 Tax=Pseudorhodoplanes sp. TaxID=1934341 RepID=UPI003D0C1E82